MRPRRSRPGQGRLVDGNSGGDGGSSLPSGGPEVLAVEHDCDVSKENDPANTSWPRVSTTTARRPSGENALIGVDISVTARRETSRETETSRNKPSAAALDALNSLRKNAQ